MEAEVILMAKGVDGVYDADPKKHPKANRYERLSHLDLLQRGLGVMDATAASLCMDNNIPIVVFNITKQGNILKAAEGADIGTVVGREE